MEKGQLFGNILVRKNDNRHKTLSLFLSKKYSVLRKCETRDCACQLPGNRDALSRILFISFYDYLFMLHRFYVVHRQSYVSKEEQALRQEVRKCNQTKGKMKNVE